MPIESAGKVNDPTNITGLGVMMQGEDVDSNIDWNALERNVMGDIGNNYNHVKEQTELASEFANDMQRLSSMFGIKNSAVSMDAKSVLSMPATMNNHMDAMSSNTMGLNLSPPEAPAYNQPAQSMSPRKFMGNNSSPQTSFNSAPTPIPMPIPSGPYGGNSQYEDPQMRNMTHEQQNKHVINSVIGSLNTDELNQSTNDITDSLTREREIDGKIRKLEQIESLRQSLIEDNVNIKRIPNVSLENPINEIDEVLKYLMVINDNKQCSSLAEEIILVGARGAGYVFNGKRRVFNQRPDLTDWYKTVAVKLRHHRHDTSMLVSRVMKKYNIGPGWRIAIQLVPSMFYHSSIRSKRTERDYISDSEYNDALGTIRELDTK